MTKEDAGDISCCSFKFPEPQPIFFPFLVWRLLKPLICDIFIPEKKRHRKNKALAAHFLDIIFGGSHTVHIGRGRRRRDFFFTFGNHWRVLVSFSAPVSHLPLFSQEKKNNGGDKSSPTHLLPFPTLCPVAAAVLSAANCRSSESEVEGDSTKLAKKRKTNSLRGTIGEFNPSKKKLEQTAVFPFIPFFFCVVTA